MSKYPDCFPENFELEILPKEAKEENRAVYRIIKYGSINRDSFLSTYEEIQAGLMPPRKIINLNDPGIYSTSTFIEYSEAQYILSLIMRHEPKAFIAEGETEGACGPSQLTSERNQKATTHVDWWIYKDSQPQKYFKKGKNDE